ncbi:hypothetical protein ACFVGN_13010 [Streptomyces sp. NPDC057757]|uniref:hypothetical protein n=1 Tax=Streptomyces sp. NPDC057757 TaxID=3346241 RepID=UPI00367A9EB7
MIADASSAPPQPSASPHPGSADSAERPTTTAQLSEPTSSTYRTQPAIPDGVSNATDGNAAGSSGTALMPVIGSGP